MIGKLRKITGIKRPATDNEEQDFLHDLIEREAEIGGTLFGPTRPGVKREFFCLDEYTWIFYEQRDENSRVKSNTIKYNVRENMVVKSQNGQAYRRVSSIEAKRLLDAAIAYQKKISEQIYQPILGSG